MTRPPLAVVFVAVLMVALGATAGAVMSQLRLQTERYAESRITVNAAAHGLIGNAEYDDEVRQRAVFATEAGLSFLHTHAEGLGPLILFTATLVAMLVRWRRARGVLHALLAAGALFPLGYLVYAFAVLERGREAGIELAEWYVLTPLGTAAVVGLVGLFLAACAGRRRSSWP